MLDGRMDTERCQIILACDCLVRTAVPIQLANFDVINGQCIVPHPLRDVMIMSLVISKAFDSIFVNGGLDGEAIGRALNIALFY